MKKIPLILMTSLLALTSCSKTEKKENESDITSTTTSGENNISVPESDDITLNYLAPDSMSDSEKKLIEEFNATDNGYKIKLVSYHDMYEYTPIEGEQDLVGNPTDESIRNVRITMLQAINYGEIDMISSNAVDPSTFDIFMSNDAFSDLYDFMENDPEINTSTLNSSVLKACETDGKLYSYPFMYGIKTLAGDPEYAGTKENVTIDEFIELWENMPEGSTICGHNTQRYVYNYILREQFGSFIDYKKGTASFDSPEFIKLLEFCGTFYPETGYKPEPDHYTTDLATNVNLYSFQDFHNLFHDYNNTDHEVTFIGYPSDCGMNSFIITEYPGFAINSKASSKKQQGAWEYLKLLSCEKAQYDLCVYYDENYRRITQHGYPLNNAAFDKVAEDHMNGKVDMDPYTAGGVSVEPDAITSAELERLKNYIADTNHLYKELDRDLFELLEEETLLYFNGAQSAEHTAEMLQNRASIYVSELQ